MGRWRPPQERSSPYISQEGYAALKKELNEIWQHRADVTAALADAAAEGDRSENAEYIYRKKQLAQIDRRIRYLQKRLPDLQVVNQVGDKDHVYFGAWVTLEKDDETQVRYRIVGADETDADKGYISIDSPLSRLLLKKAVDDEIELKLPDQTTRYLIIEIDYTV